MFCPWPWCERREYLQSSVRKLSGESSIKNQPSDGEILNSKYLTPEGGEIDPRYLSAATRLHMTARLRNVSIQYRHYVTGPW